jgi:hypothetical protein
MKKRIPSGNGQKESYGEGEIGVWELAPGSRRIQSFTTVWTYTLRKTAQSPRGSLARPLYLCPLKAPAPE